MSHHPEQTSIAWSDPSSVSIRIPRSPYAALFLFTARQRSDVLTQEWRAAATAKLRGTIRINVGKGNKPGGLWTLEFGVGGSNGDPNTLYFSDGINGEADGLFGAIFANGNGS